MAANGKSVVRARDVMQNELTFVDGMTTAKTVASIMREKRINALLVEKRNQDDAYGIINIQDLIRGVILTNRSSDEVNVYEIMTKPVIMVPADMDVKYVARLLYRAGIRRAPVEDQGKLIGMVSLSSLILDNDLL